MSGDTGINYANLKTGSRRPRVLARTRVGWPRALQQLKNVLYEVYLAAGTPSLDTISADITEHDDLDGAPSRDTVRRVISDPALPPGQADAVSVARVLARMATWDEEDLASRVREWWVRARMATGAGRPVGDFTSNDRLVLNDLEVHPALDTGDAHRFGSLPAYVPRAHDALLAEVVAAALAGHSGIAVLVGGSSTGKTRALWESVQELPDGWRLWHPLSPTRPEAVLAGLADVAPNTVVWLNEAQFYLDSALLGEQVAAGLRSLLCDPSRGPVLVLATLWPEHWDALTTRTTPEDPHAQARALLETHKIKVPEAFTSAEVATLTDTGDADPRLLEAAKRSQDAHVTQYLAGVPILLERYEDAPPTARALIHAAMDARRLGAGPHIPLTWLAQAAPGYLTETEYLTRDDGWLEQGLAYVSTPCKGIPGILTPIRPGALRNKRHRRTTTSTALRDPAVQGHQYLLAEYLDQHGRHARADRIPPIDFWTAAADHAHPTDLNTLGDAAWSRGLYRDAAQLHKNATSYRDPYASETLVRQFQHTHPNELRPAQWAAAYVPLEDPNAVCLLWGMLRRVGAKEQAIALLARDPAAHVSLNNLDAVGRLLVGLWEVGAREQVTALATRAAAHARLDALDAVGRLLVGLWEVGAREQVTALATRAAAHARLDSPGAVGRLLVRLWEVGAREQVTALATRAAAHARLEPPGAVGELLVILWKVGAQEQFAVLLARDPAAHVSLSSPDAVDWLLDRLRRVGAREQVTALATRAATQVPLNAPGQVSRLLEMMRRVGAREQVTALATRAATQTPLNAPGEVSWLLEMLREVGAREQVTVLATRAATQIPLDHAWGVVSLLGSLWEVGAQEQFATLVARAATQAPLDVPGAVGRLLVMLWKVGAQEQFAVLLARDPAAHVSLNAMDPVGQLLEMLWEVGAREQFAALATRAATHAPLDALDEVGRLLVILWKFGAREQAAVLATRSATHARLGGSTSWLLSGLREVGAQEEITTLATRLPAAGDFGAFITIGDNHARYRFGREPDGNPAPSWAWDDLE